MIRSYKYRLYPNREQEVLISKHFGCCRWVWNWALSEKNKSWAEKQSRIHKYDLSKQLPILKRTPATEWLAEVNAQSLQQSLTKLELAFDKFFKEKKGFPKFKAKRNRQSFCCPQSVRIDWESSRIVLPKIGGVSSPLSRKFSGKIKTVHIVGVPSEKYFAFVFVDDGLAPPERSVYDESSTVGIDVGLKSFATLSTGEKIDNPRHFTRNLSRIKREQRKLDRKKKGSNNRKKQRIKVARMHERVVNMRHDFLHKLSTRLVNENQAIAFENLNIAGLVKNRRVALHISSVGWGSFFEYCRYKAESTGKTIIKIGRFEPSSKMCTCGVINKNLTLKDRIWTCQNCETTHDRDVLAANNIKRMALNPENFVPQDMREIRLVEVGNS